MFYYLLNDASGFSSVIIMVALLVGMFLLLIIPQKKQQKKAQEMLSKLAVGSTITTIGGIVGEVVQMDDNNIWICTGLDENKCVMQFVRQAIHSVAPAPGTPEAIEAERLAKEKENEIDEIK